MQRCLEKIIHYFFLLILGGAVGTILLTFVFLFPVEHMRENAAESLEIFTIEGPSYKIFPNISATCIDNYTDSIMINTAIYAGSENVLTKAMSAKRYAYSTGTAFDAAIRYLSGEGGYKTESYARYWHGYLVILKPLLLFFNYEEIRMINVLAQILLTGWFFCLLINKGMKRYVKSFFMCFLILIPITTFVCMQYSQIYYITLTAMIFLLRNDNKLTAKGWLPEFYFVVGMLTCYFDFLTYPIVTLGSVLLLHILLERELVSLYRDQIIKMMQYVLSWCMGYVGIWGMKWVLATVVLRDNIIKDAILSVLYRSSSASGDSGVVETFSRWDVLENNLAMLNNNILIYGVLLFVIVILVQIVHNRRIYINKGLIVQVILTMLLPIGWIWVLANHSYVHYWMTHKNFAVTLLGFSILVTACTEPVATLDKSDS